MKLNGGILLKKDAKEAFHFFVKHSLAELFMDKSAFGITLKLTWDETKSPLNESPYESFNAYNYRQPVKCILIKLVALGTIGDMDILGNIWDYTGNKKRIDTEENFINEVNVQTDIFFKTMEYLEPICPAPVYSDVFRSIDESVLFLNSITPLHNDDKHRKVLDIIQVQVEKGNIPSLGVLGMEIADGYYPLVFLEAMFKRNPDTYTWCMEAAKLEILKMAIRTGYAHNDFHRGNILFNPRYQGKYKNIPMKFLVIDFGFTSKLDPEILKQMKELYSEKRFQEALKLFKGLKRPDGRYIADSPYQYGWLYNEDVDRNGNLLPTREDAVYNEICETIIEAEKAATDDRIKLFKSEHKYDPDLYPLLPLSNNIKNKFYQGILYDNSKSIERGGKRKKSRKHQNKRKTKKNNKSK